MSAYKVLLQLNDLGRKHSGSSQHPCGGKAVTASLQVNCSAAVYCGEAGTRVKFALALNLHTPIGLVSPNKVESLLSTSLESASGKSHAYRAAVHRIARSTRRARFGAEGPCG